MRPGSSPATVGAPAADSRTARRRVLPPRSRGPRPGPGRRRRITEAQRSAVIALARSEPPGRLARDADGELSADDERGPAQQTLDTLAQAARDAGIQVGRSQVRRILRAEVRWRLVYEDMAASAFATRDHQAAAGRARQPRSARLGR